MLKECIKTGATIDEAKASALLELGLSEYDDYHVEVLKTPVKKTLGLFGGSPAEVKVTVEVADEPVKKEAVKKQPEKQREPKPVKEQKKPEAPVKKVDLEAEKAEREASLKPTEEYKKAEEYVRAMVLGLGMEKCDIKTFSSDEEIVFELDCGDDYGIVIGRRGETLDAIQYLTRMIANKGVSGFKRVSINVGNYREKREAVLVGLAKKTAARAVKTGRNITLEPMNPYERRIIHTAVQDVAGATSFSTGVDLDRRVIIAPENGGKGNYGYNKDRDHRDNRGNRDRGGRYDRPKREPYVPQVSPDRAPKKDAAGISVYGKVEIKKDEE